MVSATGPTSAIGIPQKNTGEILPKQIAGVPVEYISLEDGADTTRAVQNIKKLVQEDHIDALIGPSTTPNAFAILDVIAESKVPMMATVGTSTVVEPIDAKKRWVFKTTQNDDLIAAAIDLRARSPRGQIGPRAGCRRKDRTHRVSPSDWERAGFRGQ